MATAVSATTGVRGGVGLCSCAVTMATIVSAGAATAGVRGGLGLCLVQSPWQQLSVLELQQLRSEVP